MVNVIFYEGTQSETIKVSYFTKICFISLLFFQSSFFYVLNSLTSRDTFKPHQLRPNVVVLEIY